MIRMKASFTKPIGHKRILLAMPMFYRVGCPITVSKFKICNSCDKFKNIDEFHNASNINGGKKHKCKQCCNEYSSQYRKDNRDTLHAKRNYNCKKYKAQQLVRTSVKKGDLIKTVNRISVCF